MDPVVLAFDAQGGLIHMRGGLPEQLLDGGLLPGFQRQIQLLQVAEDGRLGDEPIGQRLERLLHPLQREHPRHR